MSMSGMLEMRAEIEAARAALRKRADEAIAAATELAGPMSHAVGECSVEEATVALVRAFECKLRGIDSDV